MNYDFVTVLELWSSNKNLTLFSCSSRNIAQLAGDIDPDGLLALDESQDGKSISASWSGTLQPGSCGKQFKGTWRRASDDSSHAFVLHKASAWK